MSRESMEYSYVSEVTGPLMVVEGIKGVAYNEVVKIKTATGEERTGQVLEVYEDKAIVQVFEGTRGLDTKLTSVRFTGETMKLSVSKDMLGRIFSGIGEPRDGLPPIIPEKRLDINGQPINPEAREYPREFIETGISAIDGMNTLVRGQKLPIFSGSGLPHNELAAQIARQAKVKGKGEDFAVVFCAMGITEEEANFFIKSFEKTGALERTVIFLNLADDPTIERIILPRMALTCAEYLAFDLDMHVLVILTDMTNYAEALREISAAREEVPGRRGYPGYMYTDLATIYERAGRIKGKNGSITQIPILSMPDDDITHPIPDLTGYITEGQLFLRTDTDIGKVIVDPFRSLSRLKQQVIGKKTRDDHGQVMNAAVRLYADAAEAKTKRDNGFDLSEYDERTLKFAREYSNSLLAIDVDLNTDDMLDVTWRLLENHFSKDEVGIKKTVTDKYWKGAE